VYLCIQTQKTNKQLSNGRPRFYEKKMMQIKQPSIIIIVTIKLSAAADATTIDYR
jgi:hypothetical protein